jgi:hypothetical protein
MKYLLITVLRQVNCVVVSVPTEMVPMKEKGNYQTNDSILIHLLLQLTLGAILIIVKKNFVKIVTLWLNPVFLQQHLVIDSWRFAFNRL